MGTYNTIIHDTDALPRQYLGATALLPGMTFTIGSNGQISAGPAAGASILPRFVIENVSPNNFPTAGVDDEYAIGDLVQTVTPHRGDKIMARILNGEVIAIGDKLEPGGGGYLRKVDTDPSAGTIAVASIVGEALEALDMSGSSGVDPDGFCLIEVY